MELQTIIQQGLVYTHLLVFAIAIADILSVDLALLRKSPPSAAQIVTVSKRMVLCLAGLWGTGLALLLIKVGFDYQEILSNPKLITKLIVVSVLTANGAVLHAFIFPILMGKETTYRMPITVIAVFGAISSASWFFAGFVGSARIISAHLTSLQFLTLYAGVLIFAISIGATLGTGMVKLMLANAEKSRVLNNTSSTMHDIETLIRLAGSAHNQLISLRGRLNQHSTEPLALKSAAPSIAALGSDPSEVNAGKVRST